MKVKKTAKRSIDLSAFMLIAAALLATSSCSSPVNIVESSGTSKLTDPSTTLPGNQLVFKNIDRAESVGDGFQVLAQECKTCNRHLLLFIGEPGAKLDAYQAYLQSMQELGFAIIALAPPSSFDRETSCREQYADDPDRIDRCFSIARSEQSNVLIDIAEKTVVKLAADGSAWGDFLNAERTFSWSNAVIASHGKSAAPSLMVSMKHKVSRVCSMHGPMELIGPSQAASWLSITSATPNRRMFFMTHKHDGGKDALQRIETVVRKLGIASPAASWTRPADQLLYASLQGESCADTSSCLIRDPIPVDANGKPIYFEAWKFLCLPL